MQTITLGVSSLNCSRLVYGCWRVAGTWDPKEVTDASRAAGREAIVAAYEAGYTLFDNADIYCHGEAEIILGQVLKAIPEMRGRVVIATKGGIRPANDPAPGAPGRYDFSADYLVWTCEQSLRRLGVETIDLYMLHRPDYLADPAEIAAAFSKLRTAGKVRYFGISNFRPTLVTAVQAVCPMPLVVHQIEISLAKLDAFTDGTLDQCLIERITPMAWSPLAGGLFGAGARQLLPSQKGYQVEGILPVIDQIAKAHGTSCTAVAIAWLLLHPSKIQPLVGSIVPERIREAGKAESISLTREEWYPSADCRARRTHALVARDRVNESTGLETSCRGQHLRLFIAVQVPQAVKLELERAQNLLRGQLSTAAVRWAHAEQIHLTLKFLGNVAVENVEPLTKCLRVVCQGFAPLNLRAQHIGAFPNLARPRVIWAGVTDSTDQLEPLQGTMENVVLPFTVENPEKHFHAHLTLGRANLMKRQDIADLAKGVADMANDVFGDWRADGVDLVRSELSPQGARHTVLTSLPLSKSPIT